MLPLNSLIKRITTTTLCCWTLLGLYTVHADDLSQQPAPAPVAQAAEPAPVAVTPSADAAMPATETTTSAPPSTEPVSSKPEPSKSESSAPAADAVVPAPETTAAEPASMGKTPTTGSVSRAMFTSNVVNHEPVDTLTSVSKASGKIYYFTELSNMKGQKITHRWEYNGKVMAEVEFTVGSPRWRVYSIKSITPKQTGNWTVVVTDSNGNTLKTDSINVTE